MKFSAFQILSCIGNKVRVGDLIMPQSVAIALKIAPPQAEELLSELAANGYLIYKEGDCTKISGYYFTKKGVEILNN